MSENKQEQKLGTREVQLLSYHTSVCPHCKERIYVPVYRINPGTIEDNLKFRKELKQKFGA